MYPWYLLASMVTHTPIQSPNVHFSVPEQGKAISGNPCMDIDGLRLAVQMDLRPRSGIGILPTLEAIEVVLCKHIHAIRYRLVIRGLVCDE